MWMEKGVEEEEDKETHG